MINEVINLQNLSLWIKLVKRNCSFKDYSQFFFVFYLKHNLRLLDHYETYILSDESAFER